MRRFIKCICIVCLAGTLLAGCTKEESDPMQEVYASIEAMSYKEALEQLGKMEVTRKNRQELSRVEGICYMGLGQYEQAVVALEKALSYNSGFIYEVDYDINQYLAVAYCNLERFEEAEHVYRALAELQPKNGDVHYSHGITLLELGDYESSKAAFDRAIALEPTNYDRVIDIYKAFYQFGYGNLGMEYVNAAMNDQNNISDYDKGRMLYHIGRYSEAVIALEKVDRAKYSDAALYLGMSYEAMGDYNYAASVYTGSMSSSTNPALYNQLGLCQMKLRNYEEALTAFQRGLECEDTSYLQSLRFNEAVAYEYLADFDKAKSLMKKYLEDYPNDTEAQREYQFLQTR